MKKTVSDLIELYRAQMDMPAPDYARQAVEMVDYLKERASEYAFRLTQGMAKHRAIDLMSDESLLQRAREEFDDRASEGYVCPIEPDAVPIAL